MWWFWWWQWLHKDGEDIWNDNLWWEVEAAYFCSYSESWQQNPASYPYYETLKSCSHYLCQICKVNCCDIFKLLASVFWTHTTAAQLQFTSFVLCTWVNKEKGGRHKKACARWRISAWNDAAQWANYWWSGISTKGNEFAQQAAAGFKTVDEYSQNNLCCTFFQVFVSLSIDHDGREVRTAFLCRACCPTGAQWVCHTEPIRIN